MHKAILFILAVCACLDEDHYHKLICSDKPADQQCYLEVVDTTEGYIATKSYSTITYDGWSVNAKQFCNRTNSEDPNIYINGLLTNKGATGADCFLDDDCLAGHCMWGTRKCHDKIKSSTEKCYQNSDCSKGLVCIDTICVAARKIGESCTVSGDDKCVEGAECTYAGACKAIGSISNGQNSDDDIFCQSLYMDDNGICQDRTTLPTLDYDPGQQYRTCLKNQDCTYNGLPINDTYVCLYPDYSPNKEGIPLKYCRYGGGEQIIIDAVKKYLSDLKYNDPILNIFNLRKTRIFDTISYIEVINCSDEAYENSYKPSIDGVQSLGAICMMIILFTFI